ncbi:MAG: ADP-ribosylation factor-like protein [Candidatus Jordarchaeales archaeon]|nr:GTP-binding protein [Candidatus Jordarchaeia archaeon]
MIWDIYVITSSGICLFHKSYHKQWIDESIISGFLTAFASFIKSFDSEEEIESVVMRNIKFVYSSYDELLFIICADKNERDELLKKKLKMLRDSFLSLFSKEIKKWDGDISVFKRFESIADDIMKSHVKIALIGKDGVGKTSLLNLIMGENVGGNYTPTMLIDIKEYEMPVFNVKLIFWDIGGQEKFRPFWEKLTKDADIILFVCESTPKGVYEARELFQQISKFLNPTKIILVANKQDLPNAIPPEKISEIFGIKAHGMVAVAPHYRQRILELLEDSLSDLTSKQAFRELQEKEEMGASI